MNNEKLINNVDTFYKIATSLPIKLAEAEEFDDAEYKLRYASPEVWVKNAKEISRNGNEGEGKVSQFMVVSTRAHKPGNFGIIPDDALVFIFLDRQYYLNPQQCPDSTEMLRIAIRMTNKAGLSKGYHAFEIEKSKVSDKKHAENHCYTKCIAIFKK